MMPPQKNVRQIGFRPDAVSRLKMLEPARHIHEN
jgi:hypothetical protein